MFNLYSRTFAGDASVSYQKIERHRIPGDKNGFHFDAGPLPEGRRFKLRPEFFPSIKQPPFIIEVGKTQYSLLFVGPRNWSYYKHYTFPISQERLKKRYFYYPLSITDLPDRYPLCRECGFNALYGGVCWMCESKKSKSGHCTDINNPLLVRMRGFVVDIENDDEI